MANSDIINETLLAAYHDQLMKSEISKKQEKLVSGTNIKTVNNQTILGSGNINVGGTQVQSDWNQSDNTQPDFIKNKPTIPDVSGKANASDVYTKSQTYNKTEVNGLVDTPHQNYVTVSTYASLPASGSADTIYRVSNYDGSTNQVDVTKYSEYAWNGSDYEFLCVKSQIGEVFDISVYNNNATYADLAAALGVDGANVPVDIRRGGMSVKFVLSSDNKYVQYRYMGIAVTGSPNPFANVANWQGVDDEPTVGSDNLVKSGGVWNDIPRNKNNIPSKVFVCDEQGYVLADLSNGNIITKKFSSPQVYAAINNLSNEIDASSERLQSEIDAIDDKFVANVSNNFGNTKFFIVDSNGNIIFEINNGAVKTKSFDSGGLPIFKDFQNSNFNICDCFGNILLAVKGGNIVTKNFNSNDVNVLSLRVSELERLSDGYDSLLARNTPAISWIDDDFDTSSTERLGKLNILKAWAIENNIKPDIALIPDVTYTDVQRTDIESVYFSHERLALAMEFEYSGLHMLTHPIHYGIYGDVIKDGHYIRKDLFLSRKALLDAGFPGCDIFVYAGSSAGVTDVVEAAKAYYDVAIMPGGNATNVNLPTKQNRYRLVRFSLDNISATNTVSQIKQQIDECIATGGWIIFITHVWLHTGDGTEPVDETSNSLANVFEIIKYANQRVQLRPTQEVWREKKILWEYYK